MLTVGLPADPGGDLLAVPVTLAWLAGAVAAVVALRTAAVTALAAPPLGLFVLGLLLTASRPQPRLLVTGAVVLAVLVLLLLRSNRVGAASDEGIAEADAAAVGVDLAARRRDTVLGRVAFGLPAVAAATVLAVAATWLLPVDGSTRRDPRALREQTVQLTDALSPLAQLRPQLTGPPAPLFTVTVSTLDNSDYRPDRVRTAALGEFDGALWTGSDRFSVTGSTLPGFVPLDGAPVRIRLQVTVDPTVDPTARPFLPMVGEPVRFDGTDFAFDRATATAVRTETAPGPYEYATVGEVRPQDAAIRQAQASTLAADRPFLRCRAGRPGSRSSPTWPPRAARAPRAMAQLLAIEELPAPAALQRPGHARPLLRRAQARAARRPGRADRQRGAVRGRVRPARAGQGLPRPGRGRLPAPPRGAGGGPLHGHHRRRARLARGAPRRLRVGALRADGRDPLRGADPAPRPRGDPRRGRPRPACRPPRRAVPAPPTLAEVALRVARGLGVVAGVLLGLAVLVAAAKAVRRRSRARRGPPVQRVLAAWAEVVDLLRETGLAVPASRTSSEVAASVRHSAAAVAGRSVDALAPLVTAAVYAPELPSATDADRAWELVARIRRETTAVLGLGARLRALADPRPLLPDAWRVRAPRGLRLSRRAAERLRRARAGRARREAPVRAAREPAAVADGPRGRRARWPRQASPPSAARATRRRGSPSPAAPRGSRRRVSSSSRWSTGRPSWSWAASGCRSATTARWCRSGRPRCRRPGRRHGPPGRRGDLRGVGSGAVRPAAA